MARTAKRDQPHHQVVIGLPGIAVVATCYLEGTLQATVVASVTEVAAGVYDVHVTPGFSSVGYWTVVLALLGTAYDVEVSEHDVDDVYFLLSGVVGGNLVEVEVVADSVPVPGVSLSVYDDGGDVLVTWRESDASGEASFFLPSGDYVLRAYEPGYSFEDVEFESPGSVTMSGEGLDVPAPSDPTLCRIYGDFVDLDGTARVGQVVKVVNLHDPVATVGLAVSEPEVEVVADANGHVEFDVVQGTKLAISISGTSTTRNVTVPAQPTKNLHDLLGLRSTTGVSTVVRAH